MQRIRLYLSKLKKALWWLWKKRWAKWPVIAGLSLFVIFLILNILFPLNSKIDYSQLVVADDGTVLSAYLNNDDKWRLYTELDEITPELAKAIVYKEDKYFYRHFGVNPIAIARAAYNNLTTGRRTSGASTITMQVARLLYPADRTYINKITEVFRAFQLEWKYSKKEILQLYLNLVPYGSNVEGVKSATLLYLNKMPNHLSVAEITALAIIPNRPVSLALGVNNYAIEKERNKWLLRFKSEGVFTDKVIDDALTEPFDAQRCDAPNFAPHLSRRLKENNPAQPIIKTAIQFNRQQEVEHIVANYINRLRNINIQNSAVMVVDNQTRKVLCYVGSADFNNPADGGQVDGVLAIRSPGSALKPFLYARAFELGIATPRTTINDVPLSIAGYEPENYDEKFHGRITLGNALALSLNIPAVKLLDEVTVEDFSKQLVKAGFSTIKQQKKNLGLSLILGGCGVKLEEMTALYSAFANYGVYAPLNYIKSDTIALRVPIVSPEATYMVTNILTQITRPDLPYNYQSSPHLPKIAWKTGTSYGRRDAWSIGYNRRYTIGVWVGNFSGVGVPELSGAEIATPLLFEIFNKLDYNSSVHWYSPPPKIDLRLVCSHSGDIPAPYCTDLVQDYYIPGISRSVACSHKKQVSVNADSSISYCTNCQPASGYIRKLYDNLSAELVSYYELNHINYPKIPPHNPQCLRVFRDNAPQIASPADGTEYLIEAAEPQKIMLSANTPTDVKFIYWYIDDKFYKKTPARQPVFFTPSTGRIKISCADDKGRNSDVYITVEAY
jgi:penicillin-binding protein 1C